MPSERSGGSEGSKHPEDDDNEAPETPLDEPRPPRMQEPPPEPDPKHPYVVTHVNEAHEAESSATEHPRGLVAPRAEENARLGKLEAQGEYRRA